MANIIIGTLFGIIATIAVFTDEIILGDYLIIILLCFLLVKSK